MIDPTGPFAFRTSTCRTNPTGRTTDDRAGRKLPESLRLRGNEPFNDEAHALRVRRTDGRDDEVERLPNQRLRLRNRSGRKYAIHGVLQFVGRVRVEAGECFLRNADRRTSWERGEFPHCVCSEGDRVLTVTFCPGPHPRPGASGAHRRLRLRPRPWRRT